MCGQECAVRPQIPDNMNNWLLETAHVIKYQLPSRILNSLVQWADAEAEQLNWSKLKLKCPGSGHKGYLDNKDNQLFEEVCVVTYQVSPSVLSSLVQWAATRNWVVDLIYAEIEALRLKAHRKYQIEECEVTY